jgi:iron complex transport system substrate-binding protein
VRIVSLVPHATELLYALGLDGQVVAVTHECDHPPQALGLPRVTRDALPPGLDAAAIDAAVRERTLTGQAIYELDGELLASLEPELIVTQALCPVCAVSYEDVTALAEEMPSPPRVLALDPHSFEETLEDIRTVAAATGRGETGERLLASIRTRVARVRGAVQNRPRVRVAALEWLDPVFVAGHWTPELIELAGGCDVLGQAGRPSVTASWEDVRAAEPDVVVVMPCGYDAPRAHAQAQAYASELAAVQAERCVAVDASAYFSRPGPRLVEGMEWLGHILHPEALRAPSAGSALALDRAGASS